MHAADVPGVALLDSRDAVLDPAGVAPMAASALLGTAQGEQLRVALSPLGRTRVCAPASNIGRYPRC